MKKEIEKTLFLIFIFLFIIRIAPIFSQQKMIVFNKSDSLKLSWEHDWKDIEGNDENVIYFNVYISQNDGDFHLAQQTSRDTIEFRPQTWTYISIAQPSGKYVFGVTAVDWAGNESDMHTSLQASAAFGGWWILFDFGKPRIPKSIRPG